MTFEDWEFDLAPEGLHSPSARAAWRFRQAEIDERDDAIQKLLAWSGVTIFPRTEWQAAVACLLGYDPHQRQIETLTAILDQLHRAAELTSAPVAPEFYSPPIPVERVYLNDDPATVVPTADGMAGSVWLFGGVRVATFTDVNEAFAMRDMINEEGREWARASANRNRETEDALNMASGRIRDLEEELAAGGALPYQAVSVNGRAMEWEVPLWDAIHAYAASGRTQAGTSAREAAVVAVARAVEIAMRVAIGEFARERR